MEIFDALGQIGTADPWLLRGWLFLLSNRYRQQRIQLWRSRSALYVAADICLSIAAMAIELVILFVLAVVVAHA